VAKVSFPESRIGQCLEPAEETGDLETLARALNNLGSAYADGGLKLARSLMERALEVTEKVGDPTKIACRITVRRFIGESLDLALSMKYALAEAVARRELAFVAGDDASERRAAELQKALEIFERIGANMEIERTRALLAMSEPTPP
jgi:hypothetical protein